MPYGTFPYGETTYSGTTFEGLQGGPPTPPLPEPVEPSTELVEIEPPWPIVVFGRRYFIFTDTRDNPELLLINNDETLRSVRGLSDPVSEEDFLEAFGLGRAETEVLIIARKVRTEGIFLFNTKQYLVDEEEFEDELFPLIFERPFLGATNFRLERNPDILLADIAAAIPGRHYIYATRGPFA